MNIVNMASYYKRYCNPKFIQFQLIVVLLLVHNYHRDIEGTKVNV